MAGLINRLSEFCGLDEQEISRLADRAPNTYKKYYIDKKRGGKRQISHPSKETKLLQYALLQILGPSLHVHQSAFGFVRGLKSPLRENVKRHLDHNFFIKMDIEDFFPSIRPDDIFNALESAKNPIPIILTPDERDLLTKTVFIRSSAGQLGLPIGGVASPILSNSIMYDLDEKFEALAAKSEFVYSRYADDLVFSTNRKNASTDLLAQVKSLLTKTKSPSLRLNNKKTRFMSRNSRVAITGLIITPEHEVSIGRKNKRKLKSLVHSYKVGSISKKDRKYLQGYLAFLLDVEPNYYNRLCQKYGSETVNAALERPINSTSK